MTDRFARHYRDLLGLLHGIEAVADHALPSFDDPAFRGMRAQWAALHQLALDKIELLEASASEPSEHEWLASFGPRKCELRRAWFAHRDALDFSK